MYGHRLPTDRNVAGNSPPAAHFVPCFRPSPWKIDGCSQLDGFYSATSPMATYNLALQEHIRRLQEVRLGKRFGSPNTLSESILCSNTGLINIPKPSLEGHQVNQNTTNFPTKLDQKETSPRPTLTPYENSFPPYTIGRKLFPCPNCRYTTDRRNNLKRHMLTMHQTCSKLLECCGILFRTKASLREHAMIFHYHGYTCYYCGRRFCRKALLKRHLSVHNGQKDFVCSVCDYATSHKSNLERHKKVHQRPEDCKDSDMLDEESKCDGESSDRNESNEELSVCSDSEDEEINVHSD